MSTTVIIPTYGRHPVTDNPLPTLLQSLSALSKKDFKVVIINSTEDKTHNITTARYLDKLIKKYKKHFPIAHYGFDALDRIHSAFQRLEFTEFKHYVCFDNYATFRNVGLIIASLLDTKIIIFLDDDEIVDVMVKA